MIYPKDKRTELTKKHQKKLKKFYNYKLNPITGFREFKSNNSSKCIIITEMVRIDTNGFKSLIG